MRHQQQRRTKPQPVKRRPSTIQWGIVAGVAALVGLVVVLKWQRAGEAPVALPAAGDTPVVSAATATSTALASHSATTDTPAPPADETLLPEAQLARLLEDGKPVFLFFHSDNCVQCVRMIAIVEQVYPEFSAAVPLVDVNVYDRRNSNLLQRAGIRYIPTLIFLDRAGQGRSFVGVMDADDLRAELQALAQE